MKAKVNISHLTNLFITLILLLSIFSSVCLQHASAEGRSGAWVDSLTFSVVNTAAAVNAIRTDSIDLYTDGLKNGYQTAKVDPDLEIELASDIYYELTFNPVGPTFPATGKLNPFSVPAIREAINLLIDRDYIINNIMNELAVVRYFPIFTDFPEYNRYALKVAELESLYAYNYAQAAATISAEMFALGATISGGLWYYNAEPVSIIFIIRNDSNGLRIPMGNYIADQLESIGFTVDRQYMSSYEAGPIWVNGDPADGLFHIYTGAWTINRIPTFEGDNFQFFYSPNSDYGFTPLWQAYDPVPEFSELADKLAYNQFPDISQRNLAFERALALALEDSVRVWLVDGKNYLPRSPSTTAAYDIATGMSRLYPYTAKFLAGPGGDMRVGSEDILVDSWNPVAGSNWLFDQIPISATADDALLFTDPTNGLPLPQRIASAAVTAQNDLLMYKTMDWVSLSFAADIPVPVDAWADWDAVNQEFITVADKYPGGVSTLIKSVVTYPADLFTTVKWHDGSSLSLGDFVMNMILPYDRTKPDSDIYDSSASISGDVIAFKITNDNPLTIETYTNYYWYLDAELSVVTWWPKGEWGPQPWHTTALAAAVEANGDAAFSPDKADSLGIDWINYIAGPTVSFMESELAITPPGYIPYSNTLGDYITTGEATTRWSNLQAWYTSQGHFWVGDGPFYVDEVDWSGKNLVLTRFADFPDPAGKWDAFSSIVYKNFNYLPLIVQ
ncbi:MAG: ABC transporter substrate-binding protein [Anaerolineaceae bacterium]|nr:ABC transporter substrate-binding protein [Anaerolineaceae bacterium]